MTHTKKETIKAKTRISRQDVARAASVSLTTVTHALNAPPGARVNEKTRDRVRQIARELGYRPSFVGRALRKGRAYTIGLLQPSHDSMFNFFYQQMFHGLAQAMEPDDYHALILFRDNESRYLNVITQGRVDGMIIVQSTMETLHIESVSGTGIPTVVMNKDINVSNTKNLGCVRSDHARMMRAVVDEFAAHECRTILNISDYRFCDANRHMLHAFNAAVKRHAAKGMTGTTLIPEKSFQEQIAAAWKSKPLWDGIFIDGISYTETFLRETRKAGFLPNRDFRLITSSVVKGETTEKRVEISAYTHQPDEVGRVSWTLLQNLMRQPVENRKILVPYHRCSGNKTFRNPDINHKESS